MRIFLALLFALSAAAQAQPWPTKPVRVVVAQGLEVATGSAEDFAKLYRSDYEKYARLVKELGIRAD